MTEEELEYKHVNPALKHFGLISMTMLIIGLLVVTALVIVKQLSSSIIFHPAEVHQPSSPSNN